MERLIFGVVFIHLLQENILAINRMESNIFGFQGNFLASRGKFGLTENKEKVLEHDHRIQNEWLVVGKDIIHGFAC